ncbi:MAG: type III-B CRISPR module RAMP protein Cmr1 [Chloroflexi bacterium]|nr:type III-B CRISPR module RAMP protein Cmr1 [Chloroflexota bacterium]
MSDTTVESAEATHTLSPRTLTVKIRTLTPLWTGGVDGTMDRIHETGILGSLRWWYEAIVRGLGGYACDPTEHTCTFDTNKYQGSEAPDKRQRLRDAGLCDVCQIFGATGWRRRFRLEVRPLEGGIDFTEGMFPSGRVHPDRRRPYRVGGWLLRGGYFGTLELHFTGEERILLCEILPTLLFIEKWGALGPKTSIGYGIIEITRLQIGEETYSPTHHDWHAQLSELVSQSCQGSRVGRWWFEGLSTSSPYQGVLPVLTNMFSSKVRFKVTDLNWWSEFREIQWLQVGQIGVDEAHWTGKQDQTPTGPFKIANPLSVSRIEHWVRYHKTFPLAPIVRTRLRYSDSNIGVCTDSNGESDWCKFIFGTVHGNEPICGYCGTKVKKDRNDQNRWWCSKGRVSLANNEVFSGKRIQSKVRVSWAYQIGDSEWEFRVWGWLPEHAQSARHRQQREEFLRTLKTSIGALSQLSPLSQLQISPECWVAKQENGETSHFLMTLLTGCP